MIYLAAPYSHPDRAVVEHRMELFRQVSNHLNEGGLYCTSPLYNHFLGMSGTWEVWKAYSTLQLRSCAALWVLKLAGWEESVGLAAEIALAQELGLPITYRTVEEAMSVWSMPKD